MCAPAPGFQSADDQTAQGPGTEEGPNVLPVLPWQYKANEPDVHATIVNALVCPTRDLARLENPQTHENPENPLRRAPH
jgi:hypothetical protein